MERRWTVILLCMLLVWIPLPMIFGTQSSDIHYSLSVADVPSISHELISSDTYIGTLDPVDIEHIGSMAGTSEYIVGRTDVAPSLGSEAWLPLGSPGNSFSADCDGGYFLVGAGGSADFGSPAGTISLWLKWDISAPHGRFWGQDQDFETRWSSDRLMVDWGSDNTFQGTKSDWIPNHWYFIAITWDEDLNSISFYWGDENHEPVEDSSTLSWTGTLSGYHTENDIMNSRAYSLGRVDGHVDEFRYYTVQRNLEDVIGDYNITLSGTEPGLSHYYMFEDDLEDSAGSANLVAIDDTSYSHDVYIGGEEWRAEEIEVNVRDLRRLYAQYGSFETGIPGVNVDWSGDGAYAPTGWNTRRELFSYSYPYTNGRQRSSYVDTGLKYITLENEGFAVGDPIDYRHYNGTRIYWYQTIDNSQSIEEFDFGISYLYQRGPIGQNFSDIFEFSFEILDGSAVLWNWSIDPTNITQRGVWYSIGPLSVTIPEAPSTFDARLSLKVLTPGSSIDIPENDPDLDGDSANGEFITFMIDDLSLVGAETLACEDTQLEVGLQPLGSIPLVGQYGTSSIYADFNYWNTTTIPFTFSTNTSVSFEYSARVSRMTKLCKSSSNTGLEELGVAFSAQFGDSIALSLYTYIQSYQDVKDLGFKVYFPSDWENASIADPFGFDVTDQSIVNSYFIEVPSGVVDSVGWWSITLESPNYAKSISTQIGESGSIWQDESIFRNGDLIRCEVNLGTDDAYLATVDNLELLWYDSSGIIVSTEEIENVNSSVVVSSGITLGPSNSTPGIWMVSVVWSNGSEVAFGNSAFEVRHRLNIIAHTPNIEVELGEQFTAAIYVYDQDNGNPILDGANVVGNWSTEDVVFNPNLARGWFEADFNSSMIGTGTFTMVVSVSLSFFDANEIIINILVPSSEPMFAVAVRASILGALAVFSLVVGVTAIRRFYMSTTARWNLELLSLANRIDDTKNLIGVLVIHSSVGLPVYSRILKGGFQETILSSLISAISQFRTEFSMDEPKWTVIPITEMIMALQTESFICALITVESASETQKHQLESFGMEIGGFFDHDEDATKQVLQTPKRIDSMNELFNPIFEKHFDGALLKKYVGVTKTLPSHLSPVAQAMKGMHIDHGVSPESIIKSVILLGFSERKAHMMVLEAIDNGFLIVAEKGLPPPPIL
ncbi:MAG: hypothetical protein ACFFFO_10715 [Candidatus Thorarchaeota archaeon]